MHLIDLRYDQKFEKNSPTGSGNIGTQSYKYGKSHHRLDPTLLMCKVVQMLNQVPMRVKSPAFHPDISVKKRYFSIRLFYWLKEK